MDYVQKSLNLMDKLVEYFGYSPEKDNYYSSIVQFLYEKSQSGAVEIEKCLREEITVYLESLEIEDEKILICKFLGMTVNENFVVPENTSFDLLDDRCFLCFLVTVLRTISWVQSDNLLLVKYSKNIWNTGWHNLAKICRGKVYDLNTHNIVVYPFDKFFNLNEVEETKEERVQELLGKAKEIYVTDKKDGSAIIVTNYNGNVILNTNGQFKNIQIDLARKLFNEKYKGFIENVPEGYTFVFELIHPDNAIVLDYGQEKKLYLLAIRDLTTFKLKSYPELVAFAEEYNKPPVNVPLRSCFICLPVFDDLYFLENLNSVR